MHPPQDDKKQQRRQWLTTSSFGVRPPRGETKIGSRPNAPSQNPPQVETPNRPRSDTVGSTTQNGDPKALAAALLEQFRAVHADFEKARALNLDPDSAMVQAHFAFRDAVQRRDLQEAARQLRKLKAEIRKTQITEDRRQAKVQRDAEVQQMTGRLAGRAKIIKGAAFQKGTAEKLDKELAANKNPSFSDFITKLSDAETLRSPNSVTALKLAAETAKQTLEGITNPTPNDKKRLAAVEYALKEVRLWKLAEEQEALATMPDGPDKEHQTGALFSKMLFEEGDSPAKLLEGKDKGVSGAWWVERTPGIGQRVEGAGQKKQFLFKPMEEEEQIDGFPLGGSALREILGKTTADTMREMTGIDFGAPPTYFVPIAVDKLPGNKGTGAKDEFVGSLQQFAPSRGTPKDLLETDPTFLETKLSKAPKSEAHKLALLDMVTLNTDRHFGNIMIGGGDGDDMKLIPIDHGLTFPSYAGFVERGKKLGLTHNVLSHMDARDEMMDEDMQERIDLIDPAALGAKLREAHAVMVRSNPEAAAKIDIDESVRLMTRSVEFLKKASKQLTVAEMLGAYANGIVHIFDSSDEEKEAKFDELIARSKANGAAERELRKLFPDEDARAECRRTLQKLGWVDSSLGLSGFTVWVESNAKLCLQIVKSNRENPVARRQVNEQISALGGPEALDFNPGALSLHELRERLMNLEIDRNWAGLAPVLEGMGKDITQVPSNQQRRVYEAADRFREFGGDDALRQRGLNPDAMDFNAKVEAADNALFERLNANGDFERMTAAYPAYRELQTVGERIDVLKAYLDFQALGGMPRYLELGGDAEGGNVVQQRNRLRLFLDQLAAAQTLQFDGKSDDELRKMQPQHRLEKAVTAISSLPNRNLQTALMGLYRKALELFDAGDFDGANTNLDKIDAALDEAHKVLREKKQQQQALEKRLEALIGSIEQVQDRTMKARLLSAYQTALLHKDQNQFAECDKAIVGLGKAIAEVLRRQQGDQ